MGLSKRRLEANILKYFRFNKIFLVLIFIIAVYLRLDAYFINNSFFTDEILLAQNIFERNYAELFLPLNYFQSAPYLFLVISKSITSIIGINELCFRWFPCLSGVVSVFGFYFLLKDLCKNIWVQLIGLFTFSISYQLLFYSQAFKQYSSDVLVSIGILFLISKLFKTNISTIKSFGIGFLWTIALMLSFPAYIMLTGFYTACILTKKNIRIYFSLIPPLLFTLFYYGFNLSKVASSAYLNEYWQKGFAIFSPEIYKLNFDFLFQYYSYPIVFLILVVLGLFFLFKNKKFYFWNLLWVLIYTLLAAYLKMYPFERRLSLFLLPILIILVIYPLDNLKKDLKSKLILLMSFTFLGVGYFNFTKEFITGNVSYLRQDVKPLLEIVRSTSESEKIYLYYGALSSYSYYSRIYLLPDVILPTYPKDESDSDKYLLSDLNSLDKGVYYLLFVKGTWTYDKDILVLNKWLEQNVETLERQDLKSATLVKVNIK